MSATFVYFLLNRDAAKLPALKSVGIIQSKLQQVPKISGQAEKVLLRRFQSAGTVWAVSQASSTGPNTTLGDSQKGTMPS